MTKPKPKKATINVRNLGRLFPEIQDESLPTSSAQDRCTPQPPSCHPGKTEEVVVDATAAEIRRVLKGQDTSTSHSHTGIHGGSLAATLGQRTHSHYSGYANSYQSGDYREAIGQPRPAARPWSEVVKEAGHTVSLGRVGVSHQHPSPESTPGYGHDTPDATSGEPPVKPLPALGVRPSERIHGDYGSDAGVDHQRIGLTDVVEERQVEAIDATTSCPPGEGIINTALGRHTRESGFASVKRWADEVEPDSFETPNDHDTRSGLLDYGEPLLQRGSRDSPPLYPVPPDRSRRTHHTEWPHSNNNNNIALFPQGPTGALYRNDVYGGPPAPQIPGMNSSICRHWMRGKCQFDQSCNFSHSMVGRGGVGDNQSGVPRHIVQNNNYAHPTSSSPPPMTPPVLSPAPLSSSQRTPNNNQQQMSTPPQGYSRSPLPSTTSVSASPPPRGKGAYIPPHARVRAMEGRVGGSEREEEREFEVTERDVMDPSGECGAVRGESSSSGPSDQLSDTEAGSTGMRVKVDSLQQ